MIINDHSLPWTLAFLFFTGMVAFAALLWWRSDECARERDNFRRDILADLRVHTELYAPEHRQASVHLVRACHAAVKQLHAIGPHASSDIYGSVDNRPAIALCEHALAAAGHPGFKVDVAA